MPKFMKPREVAELLAVSTETVLLWCREGKIKALRVGKKWHIPAEQFEVEETEVSENV